MTFYIFAVQLLMFSTTGHGKEGSTNSGDFLRNVIENLQRPNRKVYRNRIDVEEHIPDDVPYPGPSQSNEIQILSKNPNHAFNGQNNQINGQTINDVNKNQAESIFSQIFPQFLKDNYPDTQGKIVNSPGFSGPQQFSSMPNSSPGSTGPQQFNMISNNPQIPQHVLDSLTGDSVKPDGTISGYNYFFYPLNNAALQNIQNGGGNGQQTANGGQTNQDLVAMNSNNQVTKPKVEPLFVAMAGFVGVAVVFLSALMFIPRLPIPLLKSKGALKRAPEELASLTKLVVESIDGKDCSERIACEVGRAMRSMDVGSKPIRMMEIILPPAIAKQLAQVRRSASKKEQCHFITCKATEGTLKMVAKLRKPSQKVFHDVREVFNMKVNAKTH